MAGRVPEFQITLKVEFDGDVNVGQIADIVKKTGFVPILSGGGLYENRP